jgi:hypothetical protein
LYRDIHEKKLRLAMGEMFEQLQTHSRIDNFLAGTSKMPKGEEEKMRKELGIPQARVIQ